MHLVIPFRKFVSPKPAYAYARAANGKGEKKLDQIEFASTPTFMIKFQGSFQSVKKREKGEDEIELIEFRCAQDLQDDSSELTRELPIGIITFEIQ